MFADDAVCDPSKGVGYKVGVGEYKSGDVLGNLAPAKATCAADGFQVGATREQGPGGLFGV